MSVTQLVTVKTSLLLLVPETWDALPENVCHGKIFDFTLNQDLLTLNISPYRTPSVNQYWAIVNASLPCIIYCSLYRFKCVSFKRILTAQRIKFHQSWWRRKEDKGLGRERLWVQSTYGTYFFFYFFPQV